MPMREARTRRTTFYLSQTVRTCPVVVRPVRTGLGHRSEPGPDSRTVGTPPKGGGPANCPAVRVTPGSLRELARRVVQLPALGRLGPEAVLIEREEIAEGLRKMAASLE